MNHTLFLLTFSLVLGGCAAEFSEDRTPETTNAPQSSEQTTSEPTVNVYGGHLQRPADSVGTVEEATETAAFPVSRAIRNYLEPVDRAEMDLGPKFNRSSTQ
jgi:hypothetical protein